MKTRRGGFNLQEFARLVLIPLTLLPLASCTHAAECVDTTGGMDSMEAADVTVDISPSESRQFSMLIADENHERAAGFQHICPDVISSTLILFIFPRDYSSAFHMRNVHAPLDIAFIDSSGMIVDIQRMSTYFLGARENPLYSPSVPARAALEADVGFFEEQGFVAGVTRVSLPGIE
jgi:uncharacterized membrane protein (UPF0127 family)